MKFLYIIIFIIGGLFCYKNNLIYDTNILLLNGKKEYELLVQKKSTPVYGKCWDDAISKMEINCKFLDEFRQSYLAILFTNCFWKSSGLDSSLLGEKCLNLVQYNYENLIVDELTSCTQNIDKSVFQTYSLFFVHTQSICFYLQSERWQKRTENLIDLLIESSRIVSQDLFDAVGNIEQLKLIQDNSLNTQKSINDQLSRAKSDIENFNIQSKESRDLLERVIDQFILLRHFILVEFSLNSSIFYYLIAMVVVYIITTAKRASGVRLPLYMLLILSFIVEKKCIDFVYRIDRLFSEHVPLVSSLFHDDLDLEHLTMSRTLWLIRKTMLAFMTLFFVWWIATYKDIMQISFEMINEHTQILKDIQREIRSSPEKYLPIGQPYHNSSEEFDTDSQSSTSSTSYTYSDYSESDVEYPEIDQENQKIEKNTLSRKIYSFRSKIPRIISNSLPEKYQKESVNEFAKNIKRRKVNNTNFNFYSSDEEF